MLTRHAITHKADADGVDAAVAERDYVLAHVIAQIHRATPKDGGRLVFKGGTALRFVHFGEYRYSADLDFTVMDGATKPAVAAIGDALAEARQHAGFPHLELTAADTPTIGYIGPLGAGKPRHIKLDVTADELVESVEQRAIRNVWPDLPAPVAFGVYPADEIGAEKLRCIIQRVQCRDLYDLFRLTEDLNVSVAGIRQLFERKAEAKGLDPSSFRDRFENRVERYNRRWNDEMSEHLANPPQFDNVVRVVRRHLRRARLLDT